MVHNINPNVEAGAHGAGGGPGVQLTASCVSEIGLTMCNTLLPYLGLNLIKKSAFTLLVRYIRSESNKQD